MLAFLAALAGFTVVALALGVLDLVPAALALGMLIQRVAAARSEKPPGT